MADADRALFRDRDNVALAQRALVTSKSEHAPHGAVGLYEIKPNRYVWDVVCSCGAEVQVTLFDIARGRAFKTDG